MGKTILFLLILGLWVPVQEKPVPSVHALIGQLNASKHDERQAAKTALVGMGPRSINELEKAIAETELATVRQDCLSILKELFESPNADTRLLARKALARLANSKDHQVAEFAPHLLSQACEVEQWLSKIGAVVVKEETDIGPVVVQVHMGHSTQASVQIR